MTRSIAGYEIYKTGVLNGITGKFVEVNEYHLLNSVGFFDPSTGQKTFASAEEIMIITNVLYCLQKSGLNPSRIYLYQSVGKREDWYVGLDNIPLQIEIEY